VTCEGDIYAKRSFYDEEKPMRPRKQNRPEVHKEKKKKKGRKLKGGVTPSTKHYLRKEERTILLRGWERKDSFSSG